MESWIFRISFIGLVHPIAGRRFPAPAKSKPSVPRCPTEPPGSRPLLRGSSEALRIPFQKFHAAQSATSASNIPAGRRFQNAFPTRLAPCRSRQLSEYTTSERVLHVRDYRETFSPDSHRPRSLFYYPLRNSLHGWPQSDTSPPSGSPWLSSRAFREFCSASASYPRSESASASREYASANQRILLRGRFPALSRRQDFYPRADNFTSLAEIPQRCGAD